MLGQVDTDDRTPGPGQFPRHRSGAAGKVHHRVGGRRPGRAADGVDLVVDDGHALQGDGEIIGSGLETTMDVTFQFDVIKGQRIRWPRYEDAEYIMVAGSTRPTAARRRPASAA